MTTERRHRRHPTELKLRLVEAYLNGEGSLSVFGVVTSGKGSKQRAGGWERRLAYGK